MNLRSHQLSVSFIFLLIFSIVIPGAGSTRGELVFAPPTLLLETTITGNIRPKSIGHSGTGRFFAQNMMYRHSITVYDRNYALIKTIRDRVNFSDWNHPAYAQQAEGSPVEVAFSSNGSKAWISNFKMIGAEFNHPGQDHCAISSDYDPGFVYQLDTRSLNIERVIEVGCVPKFLTTTPDDQYLLVSNWCSGDVSIVDIEQGKEIARIQVGAYPRGIAVSSDSRTAYIAVMGEEKLVALDLSDFTVSWKVNVGKTPRHLCIGPTDRYLYLTLARLGTVAKMDLVRREIISSNQIGTEVRSMSFSRDYQFLYVVDYDDDKLAKVHTEDLRLIEKVSTNDKPIGLTVDQISGNIWVACYSGSIQVFSDREYNLLASPSSSMAGGNMASGQQPYRPGIRFIQGNPQDYLYGEPSGSMNVFQAESPASSTESPAPPESEPDPRLAQGSQQRVRAGDQGAAFHIIVGSFSTESAAQTYVNRLNNRGQSARVLRTDGKFRVSVDSFQSREAAQSGLITIKQTLEPDAWILQL